MNHMATQQPDGAERREYLRTEARAEVGLEISLADDQFVACDGPVWLVDVSLRGLKIHVESFDYEVYRELMRRQRGVKIFLDDGRGDAPMELLGTGVWIDYHGADQPGGYGSLNMGVHLRKSKNGMLERFQKFIDRRS